MNNELMKREIQEAIIAGERALVSLKMAQDSLNSAKNWGIFDMLGGGLISTMIKHSKMDHASAYLEDAKRQLRTFQKEIRDVDVSLHFSIDRGDFLTFADYFFDGLIADYLMQAKIGEARRQTDEAIHQVTILLNDLRRMQGIY